MNDEEADAVKRAVEGIIHLGKKLRFIEQLEAASETRVRVRIPLVHRKDWLMSERATLPPGILPNITDTDPPPLHPATEVGDGYVRVNQEKLAEQTTPQPRATRDDPEAHPDHPQHHTWLERMAHQGRERASGYAQERAGKH